MGHKKKSKKSWDIKYDDEISLPVEVEPQPQLATNQGHQELETQKCLRTYFNNHKSSSKRSALEFMAKKYNLKFKFHGEHRNLVLIKYDLLKSDMSKKIVQECRGIIVDLEDYYNIVCLPYTKFFNMDEDQSAYKKHRFDFSTATVYEKLDGSLCTLYHYKDKWHVSSSGVPDAAGLLSNHNTRLEKDEKPIKFCDLFWDIWKNLGYTLPVDTNKCYMFEMVTHRHVILCRPEQEEIILHGVRDMRTLLEERPQEHALMNNWKCVQTHSFESLQHVKNSTRFLNPIKSEGYVVCDANFNRVKIKSPQYVALSHISYNDKNKVNARMMLSVIKTNEGSEFLSYFDKHRELYDTMKGYYDDFYAKLELIIESGSRSKLQTIDILCCELKPTMLEFVNVLTSSGRDSLSDNISKCDIVGLFNIIKLMYIDKSQQELSKHQ
ncbi:bifunctional polynucleotide kinase/RNA ligase [Acrasis kona]|uniref:Bifunctional polynucleotide kinase/RNA ligase n=1 Tax=Acrasis kona TaxID=1008807 RepID=A0AAW2ZL51_9EUKA